MFTIICIMLAGIAAGYWLRNAHGLHRLETTIPCTVFLLLFFFGLSLGTNATLVENIGGFGWQAAVLALAGVCGSVLSSWLVYCLFFKEGGKNEE